jgi:hypothetical protein
MPYGPKSKRTGTGRMNFQEWKLIEQLADQFGAAEENKQPHQSFDQEKQETGQAQFL